MKKYLSVITFLLMLGGFTIWSLVSPARKESDMENRKLQQRPALSLKSVARGKYQKKYEKYLADQIFLRDRWVGIHSVLEQMSGKKEINDVYLGDDGYLIEKYSDNGFDGELQRENTEALSKFIDTACEALGPEHVACLFVPSKIDALKDKIPFTAEDYNGNSIVEEVRKKTKNSGRVLNLVNALKSHSDEYIYYRTDHHWTTLGAYYGFCEYEKLNGNNAPALQSYRQETAFDDFLGTTYNKTHTLSEPDEVRIFHTDHETITLNGNNDEFSSDSFYFEDAAKETFDRYRLFFSKNTGKIEIRTSAKNDKTLLVIKDSYANCFVPFLAGEYNKVIMVDFRYTKAKMKHLFREYRDITDILVLYNIEKFKNDTHLTSLEATPDELKKSKSSDDNKKSEEDSDEDDIFADLISLD